jgi:erythronate-4-phosphate dehydrogenase
MLYDALCRHLDVEPKWDSQSVLVPDRPAALRCSPPDPRLPVPDYAHHLARQMYPIAADDARFRPTMAQAADERAARFSELRKTYPQRREMQVHHVPAAAIPDTHRSVVEQGLQVETR